MSTTALTSLIEQSLATNDDHTAVVLMSLLQATTDGSLKDLANACCQFTQAQLSEAQNRMVTVKIGMN